MARNSREDRETASMVDNVMYCLTGPLVGYTGWEDQLQRHKDEITLQRLAHGVEIWKTKLGTRFEAMLYLSTASLAHPMPHQWANIYLQLFMEWKPEAEKLLEHKKVDLDPNEEEQLTRLRSWLYQTQMNRLKGRLRGAQDREVQAEEKEFLEEQQRLF